MKAILAAVDFSEDSRRAAFRAALVAREQGAKLELLHVLGRAGAFTIRDLLGPRAGASADADGRARGTVAEWAAEIGERAGVAVKAHVARGEVLDVMARASGKASLLALGARGWNPLRDMILGTTAERLLGRCNVPVLVTRRPARGPYRRALVAVDFSACSAAAMQEALRFAPKAVVTLVHAFGVPFEGKLRYAGVDESTLRQYRAQAQREALASLLDMLAKSAVDRGRLSHAIAYGHAPRVILDKARAMKADLVVIGKYGRSAVEEFLLGSVTRHVLAGAKCDVLVVPEARRA